KISVEFGPGLNFPACGALLMGLADIVFNVHLHMQRWRGKRQIGRCVIRLVSIDMMYDLRWHEFSSENFLHDGAMLSYSLPIDVDDPVTETIGRACSVRRFRPI